MTTITCAQANQIIAAALQRGRELAAPPLAIVVLDAGGHLVAAQREDGCTFLRITIALGKAWGALGLGVSSAQIGELAAQRPLLFQALAELSSGRVVPVAGGILIGEAGCGFAGAVGVSGATSEIDEICALSGVEAAGLPVSGPRRA